ncbi:MAG TPA: hypothetical protein DCQ64_01395 [Candidatus Rokubacteria bacterium]|nr:hypothetical protein [Candidatus Rokubacteria bacterium]
MPNLPSQPILPGPDAPEGPSLKRWGEGLVATLRRHWVQLTYVVNALSLVDTLANRTSTPGINHIFFTASDTKQTFVGVGGAWENVGPRRGSATLTAGNSSVAVTLSPAEADTSYRLTLSTNYNAGDLWWTSKATSGFTINTETVAPGGGATVDWLLTRD